MSYIIVSHTPIGYHAAGVMHLIYLRFTATPSTAFMFATSSTLPTIVATMIIIGEGGKVIGVGDARRGIQGGGSKSLMSNEIG